ncbi:hypothetical protein [Thermosulfurimonas sp. F29]|uniref:hypothetical protein n=1 Tax=Thermosulfurimonas sp. F29 TaxID=2867247 RepID=UPI001C8343F1|nr:hypothetical protein [Thermosulfurimonas sp. F29]MBX6422284.1 hypothetical protein [Thermosulfurimonas sp. F29]
MPVRSLRSSVMRWPQPEEVLEALRIRAGELLLRRPEVVLRIPGRGTMGCGK